MQFLSLVLLELVKFYIESGRVETRKRNFNLVDKIVGKTTLSVEIAKKLGIQSSHVVNIDAMQVCIYEKT
jgi:hypothetical protein